ncbi:MAG TPA: toll/interleukin-1 receptor domain-containing protein [Pyrinomonadaceae bacterium]|nr:toll/interleukin-1 receptor domain-containing protein [Pyrinomonadaceae bacterium]
MSQQPQAEKDVFVSYNVIDQPWVDGELLTRLRGRSITFFDQHRPELGVFRASALDEAITQSRFVLLVISSGYLRDSWDSFTNIAAFNYMLEGKGRGKALRVIPAFKERVEGSLPARISSLTSVDLCEADEEEWGRLLNALSREAAGEGECEAAPQPTPPPPHPRDTREVLSLLAELIKRPEVYGPLTQFGAEFGRMRDQIRSLTAHKRLHDLFQRLADKLDVSVVYCPPRMPDEEVDWDEMEGSLAEITDIVAAIVACAAAAEFATEQSLWVQKLLLALADWAAGNAEKNGDRVRDARKRIYRVLNTVPAQINAKLVDIAKSLRLTALEKALLAVHANLQALDAGGVTAGQLAKISRSAEQVDELDRSLRASVFVHDSLQQIDDELRAAEPFFEREVEAVVEAWMVVGPKLKTICASAAFGWEAELLAAGAELELCLPEEARAGVRRAFRNIRRKVTRIFSRVDTDMLERCGQLEAEIGEPLNLLLAVM